MEATHLEDLVRPDEPARVLEEIEAILVAMEIEAPLLHQTFHDTWRLFRGEYPGYRRSNTHYHDFTHTCGVTLAMARLLHGAWLEGVALDARTVTLGLICALFHDVGLIQESDDLEGTGAKYTIGHEWRSIDFLRTYCGDGKLDAEAIADGNDIIATTRLMASVAEIPFRDETSRMLGYMLGTADLMAQMAERTYLEKLLLLYREFEEAHIPGYDSERTLLEKTEDFYRLVVRKRLDEDLGGVERYFLPHFRARWGLERDLYDVNLHTNLAYLRKVMEECPDQYRDRLRRAGIVDRLDVHGEERP